MPNVTLALDIACRYGDADIADHKAWVIDQMVRALTDCELEQRIFYDAGGRPYTAEVLGVSGAYRAFVAAACDGEDGPNTYSWDAGVAPYPSTAPRKSR